MPKNKTSIFYITGNGRKLAGRIAGLYPDAEILKFNSGIFAEKWRESGNIICIMAAGIVVRAAAPLLKDKTTDPAVVVLDEKGSYAISLLSGHIGGANELARRIAGHIGAQAVITTASDVQGKLSPDLWAMERNLHVEDFDKLRKISARLLRGEPVRVNTEYPVSTGGLPREFVPVDAPGEADIVISHRLVDCAALFLRPKNLVAGIGCNRATAESEIRQVFEDVFREEGLSVRSVKCIATIDLKRDEKGLLDFARNNGLDIEFFSSSDLNNAAMRYGIAESASVRTATGAAAVAEPAALLAARGLFDNCTLITPKRKRGNVTLAIAQAEFTL
ncbi:MAG: cobalamin biosynthesis protein CbiG [Deferribacteres bacterium]|nr:cobalamin biosynthesis protein CbiG [Deferribacteres bacterium]